MGVKPTDCNCKTVSFLAKMLALKPALGLLVLLSTFIAVSAKLEGKLLPPIYDPIALQRADCVLYCTALYWP